MASVNIRQVNDAEFSKLISSDQPTLVDFWAPWSEPCEVMDLVMEDIAEESRGKIGIVKMNVDGNPVTSGKFHIRAIPTLILFRNGEVVYRMAGAVGKKKLEERLNSVL